MSKALHEAKTVREVNWRTPRLAMTFRKWRRVSHSSARFLSVLLTWIVASIGLVLAQDASETRLPPDRRVALVIGNSAYLAIAPSAKAGRDAEAVAARLRSVGFQSVTLAKDVGREELVAALLSFAREARDADWAVIYFAGHGVETDGVGYFVPIDAKLKHRKDVTAEALTFDKIMDFTAGARKARIVILDTSRDDSLLGPRPRSAPRRGSWAGMIPLESQVVPMIFFYATKARRPIVPGEGPNGPFATALVRHLATPGLELNQLFANIRSDVSKATNRKQQPFSLVSLHAGALYFVPSSENGDRRTQD
jgi:uncharacterized caspase-like protein